MRKLRAFTLLELLFVMILTTLVIGIGYFAFSMSTKQLNSYRESSEKISKVFLITMLLNKDFAEAASVRKANDSLVFISPANNTVQYFFSDEYILRSANSLTDTFNYVTRNLSEKFLGEPTISDRGLIDEIYFEIKTDDEKFEIFHAMKSYSAETLMRYENDEKILMP